MPGPDAGVDPNKLAGGCDAGVDAGLPKRLGCPEGAVATGAGESVGFGAPKEKAGVDEAGAAEDAAGLAPNSPPPEAAGVELPEVAADAPPVFPKLNPAGFAAFAEVA